MMAGCYMKIPGCQLWRNEAPSVVAKLFDFLNFFNMEYFRPPITNTAPVQYLRLALARLRQRFHDYLQLPRDRVDSEA